MSDKDNLLERARQYKESKGGNPLAYTPDEREPAPKKVDKSKIKPSRSPGRQILDTVTYPFTETAGGTTDLLDLPEMGIDVMDAIASSQWGQPASPQNWNAARKTRKAIKGLSGIDLEK